MEIESHSYRVGSATISRIEEMTFDSISASELYVGVDQAMADEQIAKWDEGSVDHVNGHLKLGFHAWLVKTPSRTILIDTGAGAEKERPGLPMFGNLHELFLARLRALGTNPAEVDTVLHTHLHVDHLGWNTYKSGDRWIPTFPNGEHVFSAREHAYVKSIVNRDGIDAEIRAAAGLGEWLPCPPQTFTATACCPS